MLAAEGLSLPRLTADAQRIHRSGQTGKIPIDGLQGIYYYASDRSRYPESPVNLVIRKERLLALQEGRYIVTPEKTVSIGPPAEP